MSNWSSYKGDKLLAEGWRSYLKGDLYAGEKLEEIFGLGKGKEKKWADIASGEDKGDPNAARGTVYNNVLAEVTAWVGQTIQEMRKDPETPEEVRAIVQEIDEVAIVDEFEEMITAQQFELLEQSAFQRDDQDGGVAQTGHVADPEAEEGEDLPLTFEPDGHENITKFIEVIKDNPEHVEKFVTELKRSGFSNCVDTLGCKKPAVEPGATGLVRKFRGPGGVNMGGVGGDTGLKGGGQQIDKKKEPEKITTQDGTALVLQQGDQELVAVDTDGDGKIDEVTPLVDKVLELLRQLCAYEVYPEGERDQAMKQLEDTVRPELEAAGTDELGQLIKELEEEIAQQGACRLQIGADPAAGEIAGPDDMKQLQGPDEILIDYQDSLNRAMEMARSGAVEDFEKDDFDLIYMAMGDCNDESNIQFGEPSESSPVREAVDYDKCKDLRELGASPQFIQLVAKAISGVTDGIEYEKFFLNLPGAAIEDGPPDDDDQTSDDDDDDGGDDDGQDTTTTHGLPQNWKPKGDALKGQRWIENSYKLLGKDAGKTSWDDDLRDFADKIGKVKFGGSLSERKKGHGFDAEDVAKMMGGKEDSEKLSRALKLLRNRSQKGTGAYTIMLALSKLKKRETSGPRATQIRDYLQQLYGAIRKSAPAKKKPEDAAPEAQVQQAAESLLRESTIDRWQQIAGIKKRV